MIIREASELDIPGLVSVLRASLGESSSRKTEEVWKYKHVDNPFGRSLVLVAVEEGMIVGVRAFMRWKWQIGTEEYFAFRAVDTATHPEHQGKGIFKKLTLKALEIAKQRGDNFVFNTPNSQSKPGYLKMGWQEIGKINIRLRLANPFFLKKKYRPETLEEKREPLNLARHLEKNQMEKVRDGRLFTPKSEEFLEWRYINNPIQTYLVDATESYFLAAYVKEHKYFRELRLSELLLFNRNGQDQVKSRISQLARKTGVQLVSMSPNAGVSLPGSVNGKFGPVLTFREIDLEDEERHLFFDLNTWGYSLGDFELF